MEYLFPKDITFWRNLHDARIGDVISRSNWQQVLSINRGTIGELTCNIEVAMRVGHGTDNVVP